MVVVVLAASTSWWWRWMTSLSAATAAARRSWLLVMAFRWLSPIILIISHCILLLVSYNKKKAMMFLTDRYKLCVWACKRVYITWAGGGGGVVGGEGRERERERERMRGDCGGNKNNFTNLGEYNQECNPNGKYNIPWYCDIFPLLSMCTHRPLPSDCDTCSYYLKHVIRQSTGASSAGASVYAGLMLLSIQRYLILILKFLIQRMHHLLISYRLVARRRKLQSGSDVMNILAIRVLLVSSETDNNISSTGSQ